MLTSQNPYLFYLRNIKKQKHQGTLGTQQLTPTGSTNSHGSTGSTERTSQCCFYLFYKTRTLKALDVTEHVYCRCGTLVRLMAPQDLHGHPNRPLNTPCKADFKGL